MKLKPLPASILLVALAVTTGCSDAEMAHLNAFGKRSHVEFWSGGSLIYQWTSAGAVTNEEGSDGYYFNDSATNRLVRVSGDLVIQPRE